jgi:predicted dinucleotide-binding enzyme
MTTVTIIGKGNMANAIGGVVASGGNTVEYVGRQGDAINGEIVVFAVPYPEVDAVLATYGDALTGKTIVDITNPLDFATFDGLVVPPDSSAAAAKEALAELVTAGGLRAIDAGSLKRARELEAIGFLQISLAASERISWTGGFAVAP